MRVGNRMNLLKGENIRRHKFIAEGKEPAYVEREYGAISTIFNFFEFLVEFERRVGSWIKCYLNLYIFKITTRVGKGNKKRESKKEREH